MKIKINNNLWTNIKWWDQLLINKNQIILRSSDSENQPEAQIVVAEIKDKDQLKELLDVLHSAALNNTPYFNVQSWLNRS